MPSHYAAVIIGSGQSGTPLASAFASAGHRTALIESTHVGGTCINEGCTPTKTMVASARIAHLARRAREYGVVTGDAEGGVKVDMEVVRERKRSIVESFRGGSERRLKGVEGLDVLMGRARFVGRMEVEVTVNGEKRVVSAERIFVNAGCRPAPLGDVKGLGTVPGERLLDSTSVMELGEVPERMMVVGGGYVGVEFAQMFRRFGSGVTIVQRGARLLPREDEDVSLEVEKILKEDGLEVMLKARLASVSMSTDGKNSTPIAVEMEVNGSQETVMASHVLSAAGRIPNTDTLSVSVAGVELDRHGFVKTNGHLETNVPGIYALGDIKGGPAFTHISYDDFRIIKRNLLSDPIPTKLASIEGRLVPYTVFMDPQLGRIGHSETSARQEFPKRNIKVAKMPMAYVARALEVDESRGFMKAVVDGDSKEILGFTCLGIEGGELMSLVQVAMVGGVTYDKLADAVFAHPCLSESLNNLWGFLK